MRILEISEHKRLLTKFSSNEELYKLIDLTKIAYDEVKPEVDFFTFLRGVLSNKEQEVRNG